MIGQTLKDRYTITARLGKGAMGTVYRAADTQIRQDVALKIISSELSLEPAMLERFKREGEALRQLKHPNIVGFLDAFEHNEHYVIVMEYIPSGSLYELIKAGPLPIERVSQIALDLCDALIRAHRLNIIHRDIKPDNVLMDTDGTPKLADFGVARLTAGTRMTRTGTKVGTPYYMAPEAWKGETIDAQADIWSLGVLIYEMLAGKVPFDGDSEFTVMTKVCTTPPPDLKKLRADVSPGLVKIIARMLTREKDQRYQTMREVAVDLERGQPATTPLPAKAKPVKTTSSPAKAPRSAPPILPFAINRNRIIFFVGFLIIASLLAFKLMSSAQNTPTPTSRPHSSAPTTVATRLPSTDSAPTELTNPSAPTALATRLVSTLTSIPASPNPELAIGSTMVSEKDGVVLIYVPAGDFEMGSSAQDAFSICASIYNICQNLSFKDLEPKHNVQLHSFWIDKTEVTNEMYKKCVDAGVCRVPPEFDNDAYAGNDHFPTQYDASEYAKFPVVRIAWQDASDYCGWAEKRLPTEAEWEKASRGPNGNIYPWGNNLSGSNLYFEKQLGTLSPVGQFPNGASFYEVLDLAGNVFEWVADWYDSAYYSASPIDNPQGPITGREKSIRGGYRDIFATIAPSMMRTSADSNFVSNHVGFRCVKDATS